MVIIKKIKPYHREILFFFGLFVATMMNILEVQFVSKSVSSISQIIYCIIALIFIKHLHKMKNEKWQKKLFIILPILLIITKDWFVLLAIFTISFSVFKIYERSLLNVILKGVYGVCLAVSIFAFAYIGAYINQEFQESDQYEGYVISPDIKHVITFKDNDVASESRLHTYYLENVYLGLFKKECLIVTKDLYRTKLNINWHTNKEVEIAGTIYNIDQLKRQ